MTKYSFEFKLKVVQEYLEGKGGYSYLAKVHSVKDKKQIRVWVNSYREFGEEGLLRKRKNANYSVQFKLDAIELYQTSELSYREVANRLGTRNHALIASWMRSFRDDGIKGLSKPKGRPPTVPKKKEKPKKRTEEAAKSGSPTKTNESIARIIHSLRGSFKLVELLETLDFPKATFMYWQKRFDRENPDQEIEAEMLRIRKEHKDYGCL